MASGKKATVADARLWCPLKAAVQAVDADPTWFFFVNPAPLAGLPFKQLPGYALCTSLGLVLALALQVKATAVGRKETVR